MRPAQRELLAPLHALAIVDLTEEPDCQLAEVAEDEWQQQFLEMAHMLGWDHNFTRRTRGRGGGWTTSTSKVGWPDLFLWSQHQRRSMFVELKREDLGDHGAVKPDQVEVLVDLHHAGLEVHIWRPRHLAIAQQTLSPRRTP